MRRAECITGVPHAKGVRKDQCPACKRAAVTGGRHVLRPVATDATAEGMRSSWRVG